MDKCPYNPHIREGACKYCSKYCGFVPEEIARRKLAIDKGLGLTPDKNGLKHLEIKRRGE